MPGKKQSLFVRWAEKIRYDDPTGCWLWTGACRGTGGCRYGKIRAGNRIFGFLNAHYVGFEHFKRRVRAGYELDHTCNTSICVNPWHLEEVKRRTNERRKHQRRRAREAAKQPWETWISDEPGMSAG